MGQTEHVRSEYIDAAVSAKMIRKALKQQFGRSFPTTKFSVRTSRYAGGSSVHVDWTDGPTSSAVDAIATLYTGATFDGMRDLKEHHDSILVDEHGNARVVSFMCDFAICQRRYSDEFRARIIEHMEATFVLGTPGNKYDPNARYEPGWMSDLLNRISYRTVEGGEIQDGVHRAY